MVKDCQQQNDQRFNGIDEKNLVLERKLESVLARLAKLEEGGPGKQSSVS